MTQFGIARALATILLLLAWIPAGYSQPALIGIDFGPAGGVPQNWNPVAGVGTFTNLVDEAGNPVPITLTVAGVGVANFPVLPLPSSIPQHSNDLANLAGSVYTFEDRVDLEFSGLVPDQLYQLWVFAVRDIEGRPGAAFEHQIRVNGELRSTQSGDDRELVVNSRVGSSSVSLDRLPIAVSSTATGTLSVVVEDPGNLNILGGGVYLAGVALREWDGSRPFHGVPSLPGVALLLLAVLLAWTGARRAYSA